MIRDNWQFLFSAGKVAEAAGKKKAHHEGRLKFWEEAKQKTLAEVKEAGIEVSLSPANTHSNKVSGYGPQVVVRADLQRRLNESHEKIMEHHGKVVEYAGWDEVLSGNPRAMLNLDAEDYLYFFGEN